MTGPPQPPPGHGPPPPYGPPPQNGPPPYGPPPYGPPQYGATPYGPPPYGQPPPPEYGQPPYEAPYPPSPYGPPYGAPGGDRPAPLPSHPHAEPVPYHRILRTWTYRPWRVMAGMLLTLTVGVLVGPMLVLLLVAAGVELFGIGSAGDLLEGLGLGGGFTPAALLVINLSLALLIPVTWLAVRYLHNLRPRWLGSVRPGLRWGLLARCFGVAVLSSVLFSAAAQWLLPGEVAGDDGGGGGSQGLGTTVAFLVIIALTSPLQSAGEEYFFRGYLLQGFGALVRAPWFTLTCTSLLFAAAHGSQNLPLFVDRFFFGLVAGGLVLFTGGLEAGIAMHIVNNVIVLALAAATGALPQTLGTSEASWSLVVFDLGQFALFAALVVWMCRRTRTQRRTAGPPEAVPVP